MLVVDARTVALEPKVTKVKVAETELMVLPVLPEFLVNEVHREHRVISETLDKSVNLDRRVSLA